MRGLAHAQISHEQKKKNLYGVRGTGKGIISLPHFITSPTVFSHNLTLLLSPSQPHSTTSFLPNTGGYILKQWQVYICWAQSMDLRNLWIALREAWIHALRDDPWIVCSIRGLHNSLCAKYRFASDPRLSPRLQWICIAFITVIASIIK